MIKMLGEINLSKKFDKQLRKSPTEIKVALRKRLEIFTKNPFHPLLNNHHLVGKYSWYRSINITGDWRALYREVEDEDNNIVIIFEVMGTHSQLYR